MHIAIVLGTRPEIIKMSPIIRYCEERGLDYSLIHTGQHYSYELDAAFFHELELPRPDYKLDVGSGTHAEQTGKILVGLESILMRDRPDVVLVGDTNTVMGSALSAAKLNVDVGHVEAGLRSWDRTMPEEVNRLLTDHLSSTCLPPQRKQKAIFYWKVSILIGSGLPETLLLMRFSRILRLHTSGHRFSKISTLHGSILLTTHRQENVDNRVKLESLITALEALYSTHGLPILFPAHPRTSKRLWEFGLSMPEGVRIIGPQGYLAFLLLEKSARLILTDSGGIQEEACILHVPCITLRENTERPETLDVGGNVLTGVDPERILKAASTMLSTETSWVNPFGDGLSGKRIIETLLNIR